MTKTDNQSDAWAALFLTGCLFAVGQAVQVNRGGYHPEAMEWLAYAMLACVLGVAYPPLARFETPTRWLVLLAAGAGLIYQVGQLVTTVPGNIGQPPPDIMAPYLRAVALAAVAGGAGLSDRPWLGKAVPALLVSAYLFLGRWMVHVQPTPFIDVYFFQTEGVRALFAGQNPYAMRFPDIYRGMSPFYGPGMSVNGILQFGFPYPPMSLFLSALGQAAGGDPRYAQVACVGVAGLLIAYARPGRIANAALALFLLTPRTIFIIDQAWTEPFVVFGLAATVFAAIRLPKAAPYALGMFLVTKQYLVLAAPLIWLLIPPSLSWREKIYWVLKAAGVGAVLTLPLALWNPIEFWRDVAALQVHQPFRPDAMSYLAWWVHQGHPPPSTSWAFAAAAAGIALSLWRLPRTPFGFAAGVSITFLLFFAFNKQAFCNYYYFVLGSLAIAIAAASPARTEPSAVSAAR